MSRILFLDCSEDLLTLWRRVYRPGDPYIAINMAPVAADRIPALLAGYLTGFDRWTSDVYDIEGPTGFDGAMRWLDYYCQVHPQMPFTLAAEGLVAFLYPARDRSARRRSAAAKVGQSFCPLFCLLER